MHCKMSPKVETFKNSGLKSFGMVCTYLINPPTPTGKIVIEGKRKMKKQYCFCSSNHSRHWSYWLAQYSLCSTHILLNAHFVQHKKFQSHSRAQVLKHALFWNQLFRNNLVRKKWSWINPHRCHFERKHYPKKSYIWFRELLFIESLLSFLKRKDLEDMSLNSLTNWTMSTFYTRLSTFHVQKNFKKMRVEPRWSFHKKLHKFELVFTINFEDD